MDKYVGILKSLQLKNGLFLAAPNPQTGYDRVWIRDTVYSALGMENYDIKASLRAVHGILDIFRKHEWKISHAIKNRPVHAHEYIHARYHPHTLEEFLEEWGNKQNDMIGAFLFRCAELIRRGQAVIRDSRDLGIIKKLISYLETIEYWHDKDNGMWEENEEVHASSIGACLAGLRSVSRYVHVPKHLIANGKKALDTLLPMESETKGVDMALLSLVYPYNIVSKRQARKILRSVEKHLVRERGVIRYAGDRYYHNGRGEAEWTMGFPWIAIVYRRLGEMKKYRHYMKKTVFAMNGDGELPELYFGGTETHNSNTPLGWSHALYLAAAANA
jgi:phosphorylase kinase alpha/beta subunit